MKDSMEKLGNQVQEYLCNTSLRKPPFLDELEAVAREKTDYPDMMTSPEQAQFLGFLIQTMGARKIVEIGVFVGAGTLWMAQAAGPDAEIIACDVSEEYTAIGLPFWEKAGVADRIDLKIAPAQDTLRELLDTDGSGSVDFCYIDADKEAYGVYYELVLKLLRPGGIVAFDNMLQGGKVADPENIDQQVCYIRDLNATLHADERVDISFLGICDGLFLARKR